MESCKAPALKKPAGDTNKDSKWARANDRQSAQLLIRFGFGDKLNLERFKVDGVLPIGLQEDKLKPLKVTKTAWFDEVHQDCITGDNPNGQSSDVQYPRDADGNYDKDGACVDQRVTVSTKYTQQVRQCWGVYMLIVEEIRCVKSLQRNAPFWKTSTRNDDDIYHGNKLTVLKGIAKKKAEKFASVGINTVGDLRQLAGDDVAIRANANSVRGIKADNLKKLIDTTINAIPGSALEPIYHLDTENPYQKKTRKWMEMKDYLKRWIKPELGICEGMDNYEFSFVRNQPEKMLLDNSLNQDVHEARRRHCVMLKALCNDGDPRLFSIATPRVGSSTYARIFDPITGVAPSSKRIVEDIHGVFNSCLKIHDAEGAFVDRLANCTGHRKRGGRNGKGTWGGVRVKKDVDIVKWLGSENVEEAVEVDDDGNGGVVVEGFLHCDLRSVLKEVNLATATKQYFHRKSATKKARESK
ncbi:hypothetical protein ACHAXS_001763 [Conticribra weissflogii]